MLKFQAVAEKLANKFFFWGGVTFLASYCITAIKCCTLDNDEHLPYSQQKQSTTGPLLQ